MKRKYLFTISFIMSLFFSCHAQNQRITAQQQMIEDIQKSHIDANVPDQFQFDSLLKRDLEKYFSKSKPVVVKWEFLRDVPTQSGVAYPKYYLWAKIYTDDKLSKEGAVRVAAIERTRFDITDFVSVKQIKNRSQDIYTIFPMAVCEKINLLIQDR
jgi:hypothetical protein